MAFIHNDIVNKNRLRGALNEESTMGFQHNDIVTVDVMNKAIAEGGGSGGDSDFNTATVSVTGASGAFYVYCNQDQEYTNIFVLEDGNFNTYLYAPDLGETVTGTLLYKGDSYTLSPYNVVVSVTGDAEYDEENYVIVGTGDCAISGFIDD